MKKPSPATIRAAAPLSLNKGELIAKGKHPSTHCVVCGQPSKALSLWREHDERDRPIASPTALVMLCDRAICKTTLDKHPRLYAEETGAPGHFPLLCARCVYRDGWTCTHPDLKANGGPGLSVHLDGFPGFAIICSRPGGCHTPLRRAISCKGQWLPSDGLTPRRIEGSDP